jgi:RNA polymerase-binding transcription factor DksA
MPTARSGRVVVSPVHLTQIKVLHAPMLHTPVTANRREAMNLGHQEELLRERRAALVQHMTAMEHELDAPAPRDFEDFSTERQGDEVLEALGQAEQAEVRRIDAALARIAEGSYGICLECGTAISEARLAVLPDAALCRRCASHSAEG